MFQIFTERECAPLNSGHSIWNLDSGNSRVTAKCLLMLDDIASISTVVGQAHWHHNLTTLNGITDSSVSRWNEAYTAAMNLNERVGVNEGVFERFKTEILYDMEGAKTSITEISTHLAAVEEALSGVENALAAIVEVGE